ncbi:MAG TPA: hypothetical protein VJB99_00180 [Patescibacteria group bacterium]|nr:hypothetical protein [Patescibacteria group bacterium]
MALFCHWTEDVIDHTPASRKLLGQFPLRALLLAGEEDVVLLPEWDDLPPEIVLLNKLKIGPRPWNVRTDFSGLAGMAICPFSGTSKHLRDMAWEADCLLDAPTLEICRKANDKGEFQTACGSLPEARVPFGFSCRPEEVADAVQIIHERGYSARIKAVQSASGLKQAVIYPGSPVVLPNGHTDDDSPDPDTHYVVQTQHDCDVDASVQFFIRQDGRLELGPITRQYVDAGGHHFGNTLLVARWISADLQTAMIRATRTIVARIWDKFKYHGHGSVDFVCNTKDGEVYAVEVNARVTAATYPLDAAKTWYGRDTVLPFDMRSFRVPYGVSIEKLAEIFSGLLFDRERRTGFVPFCFLPTAFPEEEMGFSYGVCFAPSEEELLTLVSRVEEQKRCLLA